MNQMDTRSHSNELPRIGPATMILLGTGWFGAQIFWAFHTGTMPLFLKGFTDSKLTISLVPDPAAPARAGCEANPPR
jgi:hypothetical protein